DGPSCRGGGSTPGSTEAHPSASGPVDGCPTLAGTAAARPVHGRPTVARTAFRLSLNRIPVRSQFGHNGVSAGLSAPTPFARAPSAPMVLPRSRATGDPLAPPDPLRQTG